MDTNASHNSDANRLKIRLAADEDRPALRSLFEASHLEGQVALNDTGADLDNLREAYFADEGASCFWVAQHEAQVVGMIGVQRISDNSAEVRRLRVHEAFRRVGVGTQLMREALSFCRRQNYLKIILDVRIERSPAIALFEKFGFRHVRSREVEGRRMLDFYLDLYSDPKG